MANHKLGKANIVIGFISKSKTVPTGRAFLDAIPRPGLEGAPSATVVKGAYETLVLTCQDQSQLSTFEEWMNLRYPEVEKGSAGARPLILGESKDYTASQSENAKTASVRVPVDLIGVGKGEKATAHALTVADARAMLERMTGNVILVVQGPPTTPDAE
jgi:hypothetical protein